MCVANAELGRQHSKEDQRKTDDQKMLTFAKHPEHVYSAHLTLGIMLSSGERVKITVLVLATLSHTTNWVPY
jgi:hypothetical protein